MSILPLLQVSSSSRDESAAVASADQPTTAPRVLQHPNQQLIASLSGPANSSLLNTEVADDGHCGYGSRLRCGCGASVNICVACTTWWYSITTSLKRGWDRLRRPGHCSHSLEVYADAHIIIHDAQGGVCGSFRTACMSSVLVMLIIFSDRFYLFS
jgi:hypothetical protein